MKKEENMSKFKLSEQCKKCIYYNGKGNCWARKGQAIYGAYGCDFRPNEKQITKGVENEE